MLAILEVRDRTGDMSRQGRSEPSAVSHRIPARCLEGCHMIRHSFVEASHIVGHLDNIMTALSLAVRHITLAMNLDPGVV